MFWVPIGKYSTKFILKSKNMIDPTVVTYDNIQSYFHDIIIEALKRRTEMIDTEAGEFNTILEAYAVLFEILNERKDKFLYVEEE